jgi:hypothetical protein
VVNCGELLKHHTACVLKKRRHVGIQVQLLGWGGIEYPSRMLPRVVEGEEKGKTSAVVLEECPCNTSYMQPQGQRSVPHIL